MYQIGSPHQILQNVHYKARRRSNPTKRKRGERDRDIALRDSQIQGGGLDDNRL